MRLTTEPELEFEPLRQQVEAAIAVLERLGERARPGQSLAAARLRALHPLPHRAGRAGDRQRHRARPACRRRTAGGLRARHADRGRLLGTAARRRRHRALPPPAGRRRREPLCRGQRPLCPRRPGGHAGPLRRGPRAGGPGDGDRRDLRPRLPERRLRPVRGRGRAAGRSAGRRRDPGWSTATVPSSASARRANAPTWPPTWPMRCSPRTAPARPLATPTPAGRWPPARTCTRRSAGAAPGRGCWPGRGAAPRPSGWPARR